MKVDLKMWTKVSGDGSRGLDNAEIYYEEKVNGRVACRHYLYKESSWKVSLEVNLDVFGIRMRHNNEFEHLCDAYEQFWKEEREFIVPRLRVIGSFG